MPSSGGRKPVRTSGGRLVFGSIDWKVAVIRPVLVFERQLDQDVERQAVVGHRHRRLEMLAAGRDGDDVVAEADLGELQGAPVDVGIERVGHHHALGRGRGRGVVLEIDAVGQHGVTRDESLGPVAGRAGLGVRVVRMRGGWTRNIRCTRVMVALAEQGISDRVVVEKEAPGAYRNSEDLSMYSSYRLRSVMSFSLFANEFGSNNGSSSQARGTYEGPTEETTSSKQSIEFRDSCQIGNSILKRVDLVIDLGIELLLEFLRSTIRNPETGRINESKRILDGVGVQIALPTPQSKRVWAEETPLVSSSKTASS